MRRDTNLEVHSDEHRSATVPIILVVTGPLILAGLLQGSASGLIVAGVALLVALFVIPLHWLPGLALVVFALIPVYYLAGVPALFSRYLTPSTIVLLVWAIRTLLRRRRRMRYLPLALLWATVLVMSALASESAGPALLWAIPVGAALVIPLVLGTDAMTRRATLTAAMVIGILLGSLAVFEAATQQGLYELLLGQPLERQKWSVYRIETTLGHPLTNGAFFAVIASVAVGASLQRSHRLAPIAAILSGAATVLTVSRSAILALAVGVALTVFLALVRRDVSLMRKFLLSGGIGLALFIVSQATILATRFASSEGEASADYRDQVLEVGMQLLAHHELLGRGPGLSRDYAATTGLGLPLENAYVAALVSLGFIGAALTFAWFVLGVIRVFRTAQLDAIAVVAPFLVIGLGMPLWENIPALLILFAIGPLLAVERKRS